MLRIVHTADWQLGCKLRFLHGDRGVRARSERVAAVRRVAALAHDRRAHAVVVAGDVFDDDAVGPNTVALAREALAAFAPIPVLLVPGACDPTGPGAILGHLRAPHVHVLLDTTPLDLGPARFYPCPVSRVPADPTAGLPDRAPGDPIRVAIAHGPVVDGPGRIDVDRAAARVDYLALGGAHGTHAVDPRAWYPGTPEPTRSTESRPPPGAPSTRGNALVVEIDGPGEVPRVDVIRVARTRWETRRWTFASAADVEGLASWLRALPARADTLVELQLDGALSFAARAALDDLLADEAEALLHLRWDADAVGLAPTPDDLAVLAADGFVGDAATDLRGDPSPTARDALRLLHRLLAGAA